MVVLAFTVSVETQCDELKMLSQDLLPLAMMAVMVFMISAENQCNELKNAGSTCYHLW